MQRGGSGRSKHHDDAKKGGGHDRRHSNGNGDDIGVDSDSGGRLRGSRREGTNLTEEEEQLYAKAKEFLERNAVKNDVSGHHRRSRKHDHNDRPRHRHREDEREHRHRRSRRKDEEEDDDDSGKRRSHHHSKESKKKHKHSRHSHRHHRHSRHGDGNDDDDGDKGGSSSRKPKKSKRSHHTHHPTTYTGDEEFKNKASPIDDPSKLVPLGNILGKPPVDEKKLDAESDYFSHNVHLRLYLYRTYGIYLEDLSSSESHCAFAEFTKLYNTGTIEEAYYAESLPQEAVDQCSRTKHKWTFRTNKLEEQSLEMVRAGVKKQTEYHSSSATTSTVGAMSVGPAAAAAPTNNVAIDQQPHFDNTHAAASRRHTEKAHRERIKLANEEIHGVQSGKADTGWERNREKKREQSEKLHGAHRDRESEGLELNDDDIYGTSAGGGGNRRGGDVSFEEALAKQRQYRERKEAETATRRAGLLEKEAERQKKMFEALGLSGMMKPGEKITIAPRNDGPR
jgi:hypothetical protein